MLLTGLGEPLSDAIAPVLLREMPCERHCVEGTQHLGEADLVRSLHSRVPQTWNGRLADLFGFFLSVFGPCDHAVGGQ